MTEPFYQTIVLIVKGAFSGLGLKIDVVGEENIPLVGGAILAINHTSYLDFALGGDGNAGDIFRQAGNGAIAAIAAADIPHLI